ncbi:MAG: transaldolase [Bdellovibrionales bacterium]|nr:transaldolase [Bdellovibrionales bacterium]
MKKVNPTIQALNTIGQSIWYDNLSLEVLRSGELEGLVNQGVSGLTSNPTIFKKAIADTDHYDDSIRELVQGEISTDDLLEELMVRDVGAAADLLRATYDSSDGLEGYASIEVSPVLANDTVGTIQAAKRIWAKLNRPNIMIKIPATAAGIPAIQQTLSSGISVNVTLIFSVEVYSQVVQAYLNGLQELGDSSKLPYVASVASFFVSRVDSAVEARLDKLSNVPSGSREKLLGAVGIANSKMAYSHFLEVFNSSEFQELASKGARVQRPLWASTGVKNPTYGELLYVKALAGRNTVNTLPPKTLNALLEGADIKAEVESGFKEASACLSLLREVGIELEDVLTELQEQGVDAFRQSYDELISAIDEKRKRIAAK